MYNLNNRGDIKKFLQNEILNTTEALDILGFTRQYLNQLIKRGEVEPIKEMPRDRLFLKSEVLDYVKNKRG